LAQIVAYIVGNCISYIDQSDINFGPNWTIQTTLMLDKY